MGKLSRSDLDSVPPVRLLALLGLASRPQEATTGTRLRGTRKDSLVATLQRFAEKTGWAALDLLDQTTGAEVPLEKLREEVDAARTFAAEAADPEEWFTASFVYHVAIAAAMARYQVNLSPRPMDSRIELYEDFASRLGNHPLGDIFRQAVDRAREMNR